MGLLHFGDEFAASAIPSLPRVLKKFDCGIPTEIDFEALHLDLGLAWCKTLRDLCTVVSATAFDALGSR